MLAVAGSSIPLYSRAEVPVQSSHYFADQVSPIERYFFLKNATNQEVLALSDSFFSGNWDVFGTWAQLAMNGRITKPSASKTPHALFWSDFMLNAPSSERKEFLQYLLQAQLANPSLRAHFSRCVPQASDPVKKWLLKYYAAFDHPQRSPLQNQPLGPHLLLYSHLPDERMIGLAVRLAVADVLPYLLRFIEAERYFYQLQTDYNTAPEEIDTVMGESLRALVLLGESNPNARALVSKSLETMATLTKPNESIVLELHNTPGMGKNTTSITRTVIHSKMVAKTNSAPSNIPETSNWGDQLDAIPTRLNMILWAQSALQGDPSTREKLFASPAKLPGTAWVATSEEGSHILNKGTIFSLKSDLSSTDLQTGASHLNLNLTPGAQRACIIGRGRNHLSMTSAGDPVIKVDLFDSKSPSTRTYVVFIFDHETGEVKSSFKVDSGRDAAGPYAVVGGFLFEDGKSIWKQDPTGKKLWEKPLNGRRFYYLGANHLAYWSPHAIELVDADDQAIAGWPITPSAETELAYGAPWAITAHSGGLVVVSDRGVSSWTWLGKLLGFKKISGLNQRLQPLVVEGRIWVAESFKIHSLNMTSADEQIIPVKAEPMAWTSWGRRIYFLADDVGMATLSNENPHPMPWVERINSGMTQFVVGDEPVIVTYRDKYRMIRLSD